MSPTGDEQTHARTARDLERLAREIAQEPTRPGSRHTDEVAASAWARADIAVAALDGDEVGRRLAAARAHADPGVLERVREDLEEARRRAWIETDSTDEDLARWELLRFYELELVRLALAPSAQS